MEVILMEYDEELEDLNYHASKDKTPWVKIIKTVLKHRSLAIGLIVSVVFLAILDVGYPLINQYKKIFDYVKSHNNGDEVGIMQDLMRNKNYSQKQLEPLCFFHENAEVLAEYVNRFGINDRIKDLRCMSDVVYKSTMSYSHLNLSARDLKVLLTSNDEDVVWMAKKLIKNRYNTAVQRNLLSSRTSADSRFSRILRGVTMKVAKGIMTDTIAIRIARSVTEE